MKMKRKIKRHLAHVTFKDNKGHTMVLDSMLTIADLVKRGMMEIRLEPEHTPLPDGWWRNVEDK